MKKRYFFGFLVSILALGLAFSRCSFPMGDDTKAPPSATQIEIVVGGKEGVQNLNSLPDVIRDKLGGNLSLPYTVTFADARILTSPLLITPDTFPGTGKATVKSRVELDKGIHITRSNVELNGLKIKIVLTVTGISPVLGFPVNGVPVYYDADTPANDHRDGNPCAILISNRYGGYKGNPNNNNSFTPVRTYFEYDKTSKFTINNVAIVDCEITFLAHNSKVKGIIVDLYTTGRTPETRAKITGTTVTINHDFPAKAGYCFVGNNAELSGNTFISTGSSGVICLDFIFGLKYGGTDDTVSLKGNTFENINPNPARIAMVAVNEWEQAGSETWERIGGTFGKATHSFGDLPYKYKRLMDDLIDQVSGNKDGKIVALIDYSLKWDGLYPTTPSNPEYITNGYYYTRSGNTYTVQY
jgi:hypothetical protein